MPRPILDERMTIRLPHVLLADCLAAVNRGRLHSLNDFVINALENELARLATYRIDYYLDLRPFLARLQGDNGTHCQTTHG